MRLLITVILCVLGYGVYAQHTIKGVVTNSYGEPIIDSHVDLSSICVDTDALGSFKFTNLKSGIYTLKVNANGFGVYQENIQLKGSLQLNIILTDEETLETIVIHTANQKVYNQQKVSQQYIQNNYNSSLAKTLANVVGLDAVTVGTQTAKPMMRGLGFTRLAVTENGIKQEGQQWGADHGLEIDALTTESVEIIKGVGTITHGSDAIAGVIEVNNETIPTEGFKAQYFTTAQSVNKSWANALNSSYKNGNHFYKFKTTYTTFADFKVPVNEIVYLGTKIPLTNGNMTNTAGNEASVYGQWGFVGDDFQSVLSVSQFKNKSGFFAGAHGIPSISDAKPDGNMRNIGMPYQQVNHTKITYHAKWLNPHSIWDFKFGFQRNHRQEYSFFHSHYANQNPPEINPNLELDFKLNTLNTQLTYKKDWLVDHTTVLGVQTQYQNNDISGYSYLMPNFNRLNVGVFGKHNWDFTTNWKLELGLRYDNATLNVLGFFDTILFDYLVEKGVDYNLAKQNAQRAVPLSKDFSQGNVALGISHQITEDLESTFTVASNFRFPTAMELSSNGIHHGAFRHEQGNPNLNVEKGWAFDFSQHYHKNKFKINTSTYLYYFTNYIFLKPTGTFSILPHGGQMYRYEQSKALLTGIEVDAKYQFNNIDTQFQIAYLYNQQINQNGVNYPLPFTTPINGQFSLQYRFNKYLFFEENVLQLNTKAALQQKRIAQNEAVTPGYTLVNVQAGTVLHFKKFNPQIRLQVNNVFNKVYYHHNSFYRALDIPEFGRNIQLFITIPIQ
ncbi:TonB-dependent receptor [Myroides sp. JBRI-B21084]|uniref:TonB-dependent receptor n=1 Tax=Myroides sp. JBRI-B21084 TaxID=3119977 RepID=UPI0026E14C2E|nr:TonB-dependent receptor [Paenimyroides cloacae]WKW46183.1 TonB-dependent receptor [Paenimyroides cloacae]